MRHGSGNRRNRGKNNGRRNNNNPSMPNRSHVFDSNGPDVRIRGTAHQIVEKYSALAKDANSSGDHTLAENYLQHAEHYQRMIIVWDEEAKSRQEKQQSDDFSDETKTDEPKQSKQKPASKPRRKANDEDLGLPSSILGAAPVEETDKKKESESA